MSAPTIGYLYRVLLWGLTLALVNACATAPVSGTFNLSGGDALFTQGDVTGALLAWNAQSAQTTPQQIELALRQSRAYRELGNASVALHYASSANQLATTSAAMQPLTALELGLAQLSFGQLNLAKSSLDAVAPTLIKQQQNAPLAQLEAGLAGIAKLLGQTAAAQNHYNNAWRYAHSAQDALLAASIAIMGVELAAQNNDPQAALLWAKAKAQVTALADSKRRNFARIHLARLAQTNPLLAIAPAQVVDLLETAAQSSRAFDDARLLSYALGYLGYSAEQASDWQQALQLTAQAADAAQRSQALESLYLWEWQSARLHKALQRPDAALASYRRAVFAVQQVRQELAENQFFKEQISPLFLGLADLLLQKAKSSADKTAVQTLLKEARNTVELLKSAELQDYFQDRCVANFKAKSQGLSEVAEQTAVLYPILLPDRLEILVSFADGSQQFSVPVSLELLNKSIHAFRSKLEKRTTAQYKQPSKQLYQWLIAPLLPALHSHRIETLVIVPDGALRTIPFAALYDGEHYLIEDFALATTPSLALTQSQSLPSEHIQVLLNGLTQAVQGFAALPNVEQELNAIQAQFNDSRVLENKDFQSDKLGEALLSSAYRIVHIASHGQFDKNPQATFLLTYDGRITMDVLESYLNTSKYRDQPVELLTLSACQTAAGDDRAALGMAGVAVKAGARSALASLWFINDQASSLLIEQFYSHLKAQQSKAQALRQAQLFLLRDPRYQHASYWASFLLIGNWL